VIPIGGGRQVGPPASVIPTRFYRLAIVARAAARRGHLPATILLVRLDGRPGDGWQLAIDSRTSEPAG
jgi:hypothetical protein